jgi:energy-coupling factor transporter ATP-binding protein EcfA2
MTNFICVVFGKKGSGKTTLIRRASLFLKRVVIFDPLNEYVNGVVIVDSASLAEYLIANHEKNFRVIFKSESDEEFSQAFCACSNMYNMTMVIEEVDSFCSPVGIDEHLKRIIRYGRHREISIIAASRRPAEVSRHLTAQADCIVSFIQEEPRDIQYLKSRLTAQDCEYIKTLPQYQYYVFGETSAFEKFFGFPPEFTKKDLTKEKE